MPTHAVRHSLLLVTTGLAAGLAPAQEPQGQRSARAAVPRLAPLETQESSPASLLEGAFFGAALAGHFDGDLRLDAIVMDAHEPVFLQSPETFAGALRLGRVAADLALVTDAWPVGQDAAALVGDDGLELVSVDPQAGQWIRRVLATGKWTGARAVAAGDVDGNGRDDLVGLASESQQGGTLVLVRVASGGTGFAPAPAFNTSALAYDLELLDWDGDGDAEVAAFTRAGVEVYEPDGTLLFLFPWTSSQLYGAVLDDPGSAREELALVGTGATQDLLGVISQQGGLEGLFPLGPAGVVDVAGADMDGDTDTDLVLSIQAAPSIVVLYNQVLSGGPKFAPLTNNAVIPVGDQGRDPSFNHAGLALGDFDRDGDADVFVPVQGSHDGPPFTASEVRSAVELSRNTLLDHEDLLPELAETLFELVAGTSRYLFDLILEAPATTLVPGPGQSLVLRVTIWRTPDLGVRNVDGTPVWTTDLAVPTPGVPTSLAFDTGISGFTFPDIHGILIRQVVLDAGGDPVQESPALTVMHATSTNFAALQSVPLVVQLIQMTPRALYYEGSTPTVVYSGVDGGGVALPPPLPLWEEGVYVWEE